MVNGDPEFEELRRAHKRLETQVNTVLPTLATKAELTAGFDRMGERFDRMDERLDRMEKRMDRMEERFDRKFDRMFYVLLAGLGAALLAAVGLIGALLLRPAQAAPGTRAPAASAAPLSALPALPAGTVFVLAVPAAPPVAPPPQP